MADLDDEKAPQHVHPDKPGRGDDPPPSDDPNENEPGQPQHEAHDDYGEEH
jgi:hypothetical protein